VLVAVEGLDGCGKTTVALSLAEMIDAKYMTLPPPTMRLASDLELRRHDSLSRYLYYLSCVASVDEAARLAGSVVADRFIASAHALHVHVRGDVADALRRAKFPRPDLTIYLHVDEPERRLRLARRGRPLDPFELKLHEDIRFRAEVAGQLQAGPETRRIDTTGLQPRDVVELAQDLWRAACPQGHS
jgi:thymidylate kinase